MYSTARIDLEAPYQDACKREERYQEIEDKAKATLWDELRDELEAEKFIDDWMANPDKLLRDIIAHVAEAKYKADSLRVRGEKTLLMVQQERLKLRQDCYDRVVMEIEQHVDRVAEIKAQEIFHE